MAKSLENYELIKSFFNKKEWKFAEDEIEDEKYLITSGIIGENLKFNFSILFLNEDIVYNAILPVKFDESKENELCKHLIKINSELVYGKFEYDFSRKIVYFDFRYMTDGIQLNKKLIKNIVMVSCMTVDKFSKEIIQMA